MEFPYYVQIFLLLSTFLLLRLIEIRWYRVDKPIQYSTASPINIAYKELAYYRQSLITTADVDRFYDEVVGNSTIEEWTKQVSQNPNCNSGAVCIENLSLMRRIFSDLVISQEYGIVSCLVQKSMSTIVTSTLCYLDQPEQFESQNRSLTKDFGKNSLCGFRALASGIAHLKHKMKLTKPLLKKMQNFMVIREPMGRFVSGFVDKCARGNDACYGCAKNFTCFTENLHRKLENFSTGAKPKPIDDTDIHFFPQRWRCHDSDFLKSYSYVIMEKNITMTIQHLDGILQKAKVPEERRQFIRNQLSFKTKHSTSNTKVKKFITKTLTGNPYLYSLFLKMFRIDYEAFNFPLPMYKPTTEQM